MHMSLLLNRPTFHFDARPQPASAESKHEQKQKRKQRTKNRKQKTSKQASRRCLSPSDSYKKKRGYYINRSNTSSANPSLYTAYAISLPFIHASVSQSVSQSARDVKQLNKRSCEDGAMSEQLSGRMLQRQGGGLGWAELVVMQV